MVGWWWRTRKNMEESGQVRYYISICLERLDPHRSFSVIIGITDESCCYQCLHLGLCMTNTSYVGPLTFMPYACILVATSRPILPRPNTARVFPDSSDPVYSFLSQRPSLRDWQACATFLYNREIHLLSSCSSLSLHWKQRLLRRKGLPLPFYQARLLK